MNRIRTQLAAIQRFHNDEEGIEAIQVVMILAIAAVALITIKLKWTKIKGMFNQNVDSASEWTP